MELPQLFQALPLLTLVEVVEIPQAVLLRPAVLVAVQLVLLAIPALNLLLLLLILAVAVVVLEAQTAAQELMA
jgi:hypothetical protein